MDLSTRTSNGLNYPESPEFRRWVAAEHQVLKEQIPGPIMSDSAASFLLDKLVEIAAAIGPEKFHAMIVKAIETCERRPVLATLRRLAGLNPRLDSHGEALAEAWGLVTTVVTRHLGRDANGNVFLQSRLSRDGVGWKEEACPHISAGVRRAVLLLGDWGALADAHPTWWNQRFEAFKSVYRGEPATALATKTQT